MQSRQNFCNLQSFSKKDIKDKKIGILGGSFNPPHIGHLNISSKAIEMEMDMILWLPALQNPYKEPYKHSVDERIDLCSELTTNTDRILVSDLEVEIGSKNTYETLSFLTSKYPSTNFTWIMGVDCLKHFHLWENYDRMGELVSFMIFNRKNYEDQLKTSVAGQMILNNYQNKLTFIPDILSTESSTEIRERLNDTYSAK
jgi:nicotinate-nucleotide adenylyltransferase